MVVVVKVRYLKKVAFTNASTLKDNLTLKRKPLSKSIFLHLMHDSCSGKGKRKRKSKLERKRNHCCSIRPHPKESSAHCCSIQPLRQTAAGLPGIYPGQSSPVQGDRHLHFPDSAAVTSVASARQGPRPSTTFPPHNETFLRPDPSGRTFIQPASCVIHTLSISLPCACPHARALQATLSNPQAAPTSQALFHRRL